MRGRGTSWLQVMALNLSESTLLILIAVPLSLLGGWLAAVVMGKTLSFLKFTNRPLIPFTFEGLNLVWLLVAAALIIVARFTPMLSISRTTIIRVKQEQSRVTTKPLWQRLYLDFLLLLPGIYAYISMSGLGRSVRVLQRLTSSQTVGQYRDILLYVAPALMAMALCMISLRILPLLLRLLAWIVDRFPGAWAYLSMQQIARRPQDHASALLLIMISLSLSIYSASTAKTLDRWLYDSEYYRAGTDLAVHEYVVESSGGQMAFGQPTGGGQSTVSELDLNIGGFISLEEHLKLPNVMAVTRVGKYPATFSYGVGESPCILMGIDRLEFPAVAFFREDFAGQSLGALMNALAMDPNAVLVPAELYKELGFRINDRIMAAVTVFDTTFERELVIAGTYDYFPTIYPAEQPTLVMNLDSIFENPDDVIGYDFWLKLRANTQTDVMIYQIVQMIGPDNALVETRGNAIDEIRENLDKPERVGLFGILNVGFIATGVMPAIGFVLYSYASLKRRFIQLGILQAIGLSVKQLIGYLVLEQFLLMGMAIVFGVIFGLGVSTLFVPFLQVGATPGTPIPPFWVLIGWAESGWLSLAFIMVLVGTVAGTIFSLARLKVFQAVKMGESM
jgi:putative ABC transport system permease protein